MNDYLKELCSKANINIVYTSNKFTVLSSGVQNNTPTIRVHKIFEKCPKEVAEAIMGYFTDFENQDDYLDEIEDYIIDKFTSREYKIKSPNNKFKEIFIKEMPPKKINKKNESNLTELDITHMAKKDFWGNSCDIEPDDTIEASSDNVVELDITVDYIDTYEF